MRYGIKGRGQFDLQHNPAGHNRVYDQDTACHRHRQTITGGTRSVWKVLINPFQIEPILWRITPMTQNKRKSRNSGPWMVNVSGGAACVLGSTGASVDDLRVRATEPEFQIALLDFIVMDDAWVVQIRRAQLAL